MWGRLNNKDTFYPLPPSSPFAFSLSQHQDLFQWVGSLHQVVKELQLQCQSFQWIFKVGFIPKYNKKQLARLKSTLDVFFLLHLLLMKCWEFIWRATGSPPFIHHPQNYSAGGSLGGPHSSCGSRWLRLTQLGWLQSLIHIFGSW